MSDSKWENFLTGSDSTLEDDDDSAPIASFKLPTPKSAAPKPATPKPSSSFTLPASSSLPPPAPKSENKVETLEEKIARVMAGINLPTKPPMVNQAKASTISSAADKTLPAKSLPSPVGESTILSSTPFSLKTQSPTPLSDTNSVDSDSVTEKKRGGARIVKPGSNNSLSSLVSSDEKSDINRQNLQSPSYVVPTIDSLPSRPTPNLPQAGYREPLPLERPPSQGTIGIADRPASRGPTVANIDSLPTEAQTKTPSLPSVEGTSLPSPMETDKPSSTSDQTVDTRLQRNAQMTLDNSLLSAPISRERSQSEVKGLAESNLVSPEPLHQSPEIRPAPSSLPPQMEISNSSPPMFSAPKVIAPLSFDDTPLPTTRRQLELRAAEKGDNSINGEQDTPERDKENGASIRYSPRERGTSVSRQSSIASDDRAADQDEEVEPSITISTPSRRVKANAVEERGRDTNPISTKLVASVNDDAQSTTTTRSKSQEGRPRIFKPTPDNPPPAPAPPTSTRSKSQDRTKSSSSTTSQSTKSNAPKTPSFTPQQRRIPELPSALSAVGYTATPDSHLYPHSNRGGDWSVLRKSGEADFSPSRSLSLTKGPPVDTHRVQVAVRIRPFTVGEMQAGPRRVVSVNGDKLILVNPNAFDADPDTIAAAAAAVSLENMRCNDWAKVFCFDHCFWSYDPNDEGDTYVDQFGVYGSLGATMSDDVVRGISTCCFAYGHTSTGKTYTMFGGDDLVTSKSGGSFIEAEDEDGTIHLHRSSGLIPRVFMDIVKRVFDDDELAQDTKITLSFVEIYQEKIRDCLSPTNNSADLRVREHPALGPYVENLTRVEVESVNDVLELLYRGYEERSTASTYRNRHSSRSHAIATLELSPADAPDPFAPTTSKAGRKPNAPVIPPPHIVQKHTHVRCQMVDLAGSEQDASKEDVDEYPTRKRSADTPHRSENGSSGAATESNVERLELKMIRRSLSTLGYIIKALGQGNSAKGLPFRDSVLTWLLKDALSGQSNTTMLATISPSHTCFDESLHTLKYAERLCQFSPTSRPGMESSGRVGIHDTIDPDLTYTLATEFSKLKQELGGNKPGSQAAKHLLQQTVTDPQQRLARLDPYKTSTVEDDARNQFPRSAVKSRSSIGAPPSARKPQSRALTLRGDAYSGGDLMDQDLKDAYRQLHGKYVELQIELENARTDRDSMHLEMQHLQEALEKAESERYVGSKSAVSDLTLALRNSEEEVNELRGVILRKEETSDRLLSELADERQARATVEKTARAQVTELIGRLEALHRQGQAAVKESQKWQQEAHILNQEKELVENEVVSFKALLLEKEEAAERRIRTLEDELRLSMDHVANALKERDRTNAEINSVLKEKADMAAKEVVLTQRIQEITLDLERAHNESKVKSELEIVKLQRDSLLEIIRQQEQALHMQQQQSEASLKMLHQRQAALDRFEQRHEGENDELSSLQDNLQQLLAQEGQALYSEVIDAKRLIAVISSVREKVVESGVLKEDIRRLEEEREDLLDSIKRLEKDTQTAQRDYRESSEQLEHFKKLAIDWETRAHYWQQVAKKTSSAANESRLNENQDHIASASGNRTTDYLELRSENASLQEKLATAQGELEKSQKELENSKADMQKEFSSLWMAVEQLNKLDAAKDKSLGDLTHERDTAVRENQEWSRKYRAMQREYEDLQSELKSIDLNLLDVADHEGIEVSDILHVVHDNHPHIPHDLSDEYFSKHRSQETLYRRPDSAKKTSSRSRSPPSRPSTASYQPNRFDAPQRQPANKRYNNLRESDAVSEPGYYRAEASQGAPQARDRTNRAFPTPRADKRGSASVRRDISPSNSVGKQSHNVYSSRHTDSEKGLEMQIEELSQFLNRDTARQQNQSSRSRVRGSGGSVRSREYT